MGSLTHEHATYLAAHAVDLTLATELGVYSAASVDDLPDDWRQGIGRHLPGIVFPWTSHDGRVCVQLRPDAPPIDDDGEPKKYVFPKGVAPVLWQVRSAPGSTKVLIVEGSKQCLVAARYAPLGFDVYGIAGCWGWSHNGVPVVDLEVVDEREVVVIFDADAASNLNVYNAGTRLAEVLKAEGATKVSWVRLPAGRKAGLDDVLATRTPERRDRFLGRLVDSAAIKVADSKPRPKPGKDRPDLPRPGNGRPVVVVDDDRLVVIGKIVDALIQRWDGTELFNYGEIISRAVGTRMQPVDRGAFNNLIAEATMPVLLGLNGYVHTWPDLNTMQAVLASAEKFTPLDRITQVPFIRPDGSVCTAPGYDEATRTLLVPSDDLTGIQVPETPTQAELAAARELILTEWLGDMPFPEDGSRANALGLVLTPFIRGLVPLVPLAVVDGLQMSVGKNLMADCFSILVTGQAADPKPYNDDDQEHRKVLLAAFRAGDELFIFDEAHTLQGANFARAITAMTYSDRILGVSTMAHFPNRVTWVAMGNNVHVNGDMARRVYRIRLAPTTPHPENRPLSMYRHEDLRGWTAEHRAELVTACLTLVRGWFAAGCPSVSGEAWFGTFEAWQRMIGGITEQLGLDDFLGNVREWRSETDFYAQWWVSHLAWLAEQFGTNVEFTSAEVKSKAMADPAGYQAPPNLDDPAEKGYGKALGQAYSKIKGRAFEDLILIKPGVTHSSKVSKWAVIPVGGGDRGEPGGTLTTYTRGKTRSSSEERDYKEKGLEGSPRVPPGPPRPLVLDLETAEAGSLYSYGPGFVRLAGVSAPESSILLTADIGRVVDMVRRADLVVGHNVMAYDLVALARYHGLDLQALVRRGAVFDTLLAARHVDPPTARVKGVDFDRRYDLDRLGERLEVGGKNGDLKALAKEFGGYDQIPVDDPRYRDYLTGDVELSARVYEKLVTDSPYLEREHRVAAVAAQVSLNGFLVDHELLDERLAQGEARKREALDWLADHHGVPLTNAKGEPYAAPLATKVGRAALVEAFTAAGATSFWTTGKTGDIATSYEAMRHLASEYAHLPKVVGIAKRVARVVTTRTVYTTIQGALVGDRVHPSVTMRQSTGRWSLTNPGLTVLGKRDGRYVEREVFVPDPGEVIVAVDLSQVDMRAVAGLSQDQAYIEMLRSEDPHAEVAKLLFGDVSKREEAKAIGHGWNYGRGIRAICEDNDLPPKLVRQFDQSMRDRFPRLVEWQDEIRALAESGELLDNGFGRPMRPDPSRAHTQAPALMGQGCARDLMMEGLLRLPVEVLPMLRAQVHDEIVLSVPEADAAEIERAVIEALSFEWAPPGASLSVPIIAGGAGRHGVSWGDVYRKGGSP